MITAIDILGNKISINNVQPGKNYYCPICQQKLILKLKGEQRRPHFAHAFFGNTNYSPCPDMWHHDDKSDWHNEWQLLFPLENYEVVVNNNGIKHRADVLINNTVIEFQHSSISLKEFDERNTFYNNAGYQVIWVFDLRKEYKEEHIFKEIWDHKHFNWSYVKKPFSEITANTVNAYVFFQFEDATELSKPILESVSYAKRGFHEFKTDSSNILSTEQFLSMVATGLDTERFRKPVIVESIIDEECPLKKQTVEHKPAVAINEFRERTPCGNGNKSKQTYPPKPKRPPAPNSKSIWELWDHDFKYIIVINTTNGDEILISGDDGEIETDWNGRILGKFSNLGRDNRYHYSEKYRINDADLPIWKLKRSEETDAAKLIKNIKPIPGANSLTNIIQSSNNKNIIVHCLLNNKYYAVELLRDRFSRERRFNSSEIDFDTGEIKPGTQNDFLNPRKDFKIWEETK